MLASKTTSQRQCAALAVFLLFCVYILFTHTKQHENLPGRLHNVTDSSDSLAFPNDPIPRRDFTVLSGYPAQNADEPSKLVFATLYCSRDSDPRDPYFEATQSLIWRLLWSPFRSKYPFVVYVCPFIPEKNRRILRGQGAMVREIELLDNIIPDEAIKTKRWIDVLSKLHLWREVEWKRIVFLDLDAFPVTNIDDIFDLVQEQQCHREALPAKDQAYPVAENEMDDMCNYVYAGVLHYPPDNVNAGFLVLKPNLGMHARLMRAVRRLDDYDFTEMEQGVLKSKNAFATDGPFPVAHLSPVWNAYPEYYAKYLAEGGWETDGPVKVIHAKMWNRLWGSWNNFSQLNDMWDLDWMSMCRLFDSESFVQARKSGVYDVFR